MPRWSTPPVSLIRVCSYMGVSRDHLSVELFSDDEEKSRDHLPSFESKGRVFAGMPSRKSLGESRLLR